MFKVYGTNVGETVLLERDPPPFFLSVFRPTLRIKPVQFASES